MLRKSLSRAFGASTKPTPELPPAPHDQERAAALDRLFREVHDEISREVQRRSAAASISREFALEGARADLADESRGDLEVSPIRALTTGVVFSLRGPARTCRFRDSVGGWIHVTAFTTPEDAISGEEGSSRDDEELERTRPLSEELISVHPYWGTYRPILKPIGASLQEAEFESTLGAHRRRTAFCYTSAVELAAHYIDRALGSTG